MANLPWQNRPENNKDILWRYSKNPIINRYDILVNEDGKLGRQRIKMEEELKQMKERKNKYEKEKQTE